MNTLESTTRLAGLGACAALAVALFAGCGSSTAQAPEQGHVTVVDAPKHSAHPQPNTGCPDAPDIVLRRSTHDVPDCEKPAPGGYPGALGQPLG